ncbi:cytochrome c oxidase subunit 2A [Bacillus xiapuensis]|uniref:Cytochrome c oxidase subunit 2A n=1 Tax=Bacillus xiapuensis TaxID=2014075 RepID=A0ABU6NB95_9BACI|nr:cytochrome c oxidase subunit 2A [Bacillus xiapuensis]
MAKAEVKTKQKTEIEDSSSLKGTLASVFFLGLFIVVTWLSVYYLFVERF